MEPNRDCRTSQTRIRKRPATFITRDRAESQAGPVQHADEEGTCKKKGRDEQNDEKCHRLAALLTHMASTEISAIQVNAKGLGFNALLKYIGNTKGSRQSKPICNFQWEASCAGKVVNTFPVSWRKDKINEALQKTNTLLHFPDALKTALKAQVLLDVAAASAIKAMNKYNSVRIDCEYLGALADEHVALTGPVHTFSNTHFPCIFTVHFCCTACHPQRSRRILRTCVQSTRILAANLSYFSSTCGDSAAIPPVCCIRVRRIR